MSDTAVLVETVSVGTSQRLLQHSQIHIHIHTITLLLVALLHVVRDAALALLASIYSTTAAAKAVAKHSVLLLKHNGAAVLSAHPSARLLQDCSIAAVAASGQQEQSDKVPTPPAKVAISNTVQLAAASTSSCLPQQHLLPPQLPHHNGKLTVLLDLDETLLCTYRLQTDDHTPRLVPSNQLLGSNSTPSNSSSSCSTSFSSFFGGSRSNRQRRNSNASRSTAGYSVSVSRVSRDQLALLGGAAYGSAHWLTFTPNSSTAGSPVTLAVFERPGCRQFLAELSKIAEVVLFTAASEAYAQPLVDLLDPHHNIFVSRLFSSSCCRVCGKEGVKDLSGLGRDLSQVVLVDNSPYSFMLQPSNGLPCLPFHGHSSDKQLLGVILPLLQSLSELHDIRPLLASKFRVKEWLVSKGCQLHTAD